ncbi:MAG: protein-disulfide reductase DsbD N-terminal domain-containing protein [Desulfarculaceae bacterium]|nr:protein-disulfide reductase DsbD N-terminal domain-containing protein [Desulfarculaceae bacterium]MCF8073078.1 protein-disulfide reductase DsbD N-terminal domain-containing protein [Desulfarculaceae bacterium]MCF8101837.1 protein-disulfide reductase DsbD N-terminal domain-containing protein [Desulfarculaceae bacterium]MCF8115364.1 protein-disulfide reductase DsbD N-terminal domain-containing protein [Desulfarculaceae bacterium]
MPVFKILLLALALALVAAPLAATADQPILTGRADPAALSVAAGQPFAIKLVLSIAPTLHINGPAAQDDGLIPTKLGFTAPRGISFGQPAFPKAHEVRVQFSDKPVKVYSGKVSIALSGKVAAGTKPGVYPVKAKVSYQACDDQVCHMPSSLEIPFTLKVTP